MEPFLYMTAGAVAVLLGVFLGDFLAWRNRGEASPEPEPEWRHKAYTVGIGPGPKTEKPLDLDDAHEAALEDDGRMRDDR